MFTCFVCSLLGFCVREFPTKLKNQETGKIIVECTLYMITKKHYPGEPVNIHIQSLLKNIQEKNKVITTKKG